MFETAKEIPRYATRALPSLQRMLNVPDAALGKSGSCPACKHRFPVPGSPEFPLEPAIAVVEEPAARSPAGPKPPEPPESRKKKKRKKEKSPAGRPGRLWLMVAAAVGGVGLLVIVWLLLGGGGGSAAPAREPKANLDPGNPSTIYPHEFPAADPATWKVAAETADPSPPRRCRVVRLCQALPTYAATQPSLRTAQVPTLSFRGRMQESGKR